MGLVSLVVLGALIAGLIKPEWLKLVSRKQVLKFYGSAFLVVAFVVGVMSPQPGDQPIMVDGVAGKVHAFQVIKGEDFSFPGRSRVSWAITAPTAETKADRAATVKEAAIQLQEKENADLVSVWLEVGSFAVGKGNSLARATYIPDGCGNSGKDCDGNKWNLEATDMQLTDQQLLVWKSWEQHRDKFKEDGLVNEQKLVAFLAEKLNLPEDQITLPWIMLDNIKG